jgi:hypothetical protein
MSHLIEHDIECTYCRHPNTVEVWSVINVKLDPELKDLLLGGELNMAECEACHKMFYAEYFLLYHDPDAELMAFVYPLVNELQRDEMEKKTQENFATSQALADDADRLNYAPLTLFGLDALLRLVEQEDEEVLQAEIAAHLAKEKNLSVVPLRRSVARAHQMPPLLLGKTEGNGVSASSAVAALETLLSVNDRLSVYRALLDRVKADPAALADLRA